MVESRCEGGSKNQSFASLVGASHTIIRVSMDIVVFLVDMPYLVDELRLLEFAIHQNHFSILVNLGTT